MIVEEKYPHTYEGNLRIVEAGGQGFDTTIGEDVWRNASTLRQFGEATALWLEGNIGHMPTTFFYTHPNEETMPLLPYLNPLNRSGLLVSKFSQPARRSTDKVYGENFGEQRATVGGFIDGSYVEPLLEATKSSQLEVLCSPPGTKDRLSFIAVSRSNLEDVTYIGNVMSSENIEGSYGGSKRVPGLHSEMVRVLQGSHQVDIYDPEWGRNDRLWPMLQRFFTAYSGINI